MTYAAAITLELLMHQRVADRIFEAEKERVAPLARRAALESRATQPAISRPAR
jgi:hypothetical protein